MSVTTEGATRSATLSQVYVTGLACGASDVTGLACGASDVTGLTCVMASVRQMPQVWHVVRQISQVWHVSWRLCVRCHGVCASDVF